MIIAYITVGLVAITYGIVLAFTGIVAVKGAQDGDYDVAVGLGLIFTILLGLGLWILDLVVYH